MNVLAFKTTAGRDLILGQLLQAMRSDDYNSVAAHTFDLLKGHANDPATIQPFLVALEYLDEHDQYLTALRTAVAAVGFATPGMPLMQTAANLVVNIADHIPGDNMRSVLDELAMAAIQSSRERRAFEIVSTKFCKTGLTCGDLHRDLAIDKLVAVITQLVVPDDFEGDLAELYFEDSRPPEIDTILPPDYAYTLMRLADQLSVYDQGKAFTLYEIIVTGVTDQAIQGCNIGEKLHALMVAAEKVGKIELAHGASHLLVDGGKSFSLDIEDSASETMERTRALLNGETFVKDAKPVPLKDFLDAFTPSGP